MNSTERRLAADRLDDIETRANAATEGPWWADISGVYRGEGSGDDLLVADFGLSDRPLRDAEFCAAARADVPALVAALRGVMEVHAPEFSPDYAGWWRCRECGLRLTDEAPDCPTVATITAALTEVSV